MEFKQYLKQKKNQITLHQGWEKNAVIYLFTGHRHTIAPIPYTKERVDLF